MKKGEKKQGRKKNKYVNISLKVFAALIMTLFMFSLKFVVLSIALLQQIYMC